jgi:hypothetical protein
MLFSLAYQHMLVPFPAELLKSLEERIYMGTNGTALSILPRIGNAIVPWWLNKQSVSKGQRPCLHLTDLGGLAPRWTCVSTTLQSGKGCMQRIHDGERVM